MGPMMTRAERLSPTVTDENPAVAPCMSDATKHYARLMRFVRARFHVGDEANDIVQDAYTRLAQTAERTPIRDTAGFLHVTATNLVRDRARHSTVRGRAESDAPPADVACPEPSAERAMIARQQLQIIEKALAELPVKRRAALVLHRFDNLHQSEIAARLGISISMVEKHIRLALAHCRMRLDEAEGSAR